MKKSKLKKLSLSRETLHELERPEIAVVVGGATAFCTVAPSCAPCNCNTRNTCSTGYC